ncbi:MAG: hypothetical protein JKY09_01605 [Crocinitomicaceae bacterium]|nr:hypothetical protein [Crocinitomicaceae bacterium]
MYSDFCDSCSAGFFLNPPTCTGTAITGCATYTVGGDTCAACDANKLLNNNTCTITITDDANCATWTISGAAATCATCDTGYFLHTDGTCDAVTEAAECAVHSATTDDCTECSPGFKRTDGTTCV